MRGESSHSSDIHIIPYLTAHYFKLCDSFPSSIVRRCNGEAEVGSKALDDVLYRAQLELFPEALLVSALIIK